MIEVPFSVAQTYFPSAEFPLNSGYGYYKTCCSRKCHYNYYVCQEGEVTSQSHNLLPSQPSQWQWHYFCMTNRCPQEGCQVDLDCGEGLVCTSDNVTIPFCRWSWTRVTGSESGRTITLPAGQRLGVFVMGGGGGASMANSGSSGYFKYQEVEVPGQVVVNTNIGSGGTSSNNGGVTKVEVLVGGVRLVLVKASGGGGDARPGWSGGANSRGGSSGGQGDYLGNGSGEQLPAACNRLVSITAGGAGYSSDGTGAGGVHPNGASPYRCCSEDGYGYGAGGGEDNHHGYQGVTVIMVCE